MENEDFENEEDEAYQSEEESQERIETISEGQDYRNLADLSDDELTEWMQDDPKGYAANLGRQLRAEIGRERDVNAFSRDHDDFDGLYRSGVLNDLCKANPQLKNNLISAYYVHKYHDPRMAADYLKKHGAEKVISERLSERRGQRKPRNFGASRDTFSTMPEDM